MKKVLIVEDNMPQRKLLAAFISSDEYDVKEAENGLIAHAMIKSEKFDIVISDINMPEMDGVELFELLKADIENGLMFYFSSTEDVNKSDMVKLSSGGLKGYINKPFNKSQIIGMISEL